MGIAEAADIVKEIGTGQIDRVEGNAGSMVVLIAMVLLFGAAWWYTGRQYGQIGNIACAVGFAVVVFTLYATGGIKF
jgi:hypothetical protein